MALRPGLGDRAGIWYSPYVVYDLDGDGRDEVLLGSVTLDDNAKSFGQPACAS